MASRTPPSDALGAWLAGQRWFAGKSRRIVATSVEDRVELAAGVLLLVRVTLDDGTVGHYAAPLRGGTEVEDALDSDAFCQALLDLVARDGEATGAAGDLVGHSTRAFPRGLPPAPARRLRGEQSNTSIAFGEALFMKHFRRITPGTNPDLEVTRFLTERTGFRHTPRLAGWLDYRQRSGERSTLAVVQELVPGARDGWQWMLAELGDGERRAPGPEPSRPSGRGSAVAALRRLGQRTAELHLALASDRSDPDFAPEPITEADIVEWSASLERQIEVARRAAGADRLPEVAAPAQGLRALLGCEKIRHHGDYHLGQTLRLDAGDDFMIIDFEGEPLRPLAERRRKHAAVRDVAGMLRSLDYAAMTAGDGGRAAPHPEGAEAWEADAAREFVTGYREAAGRPAFLPDSEDGVRWAISVFELEKAAYEIAYEASHRPHWIEIPIHGFTRAAARLGEA
jgi:maltose alpha-D-glucosyltransferase/alpha-amylase